jgi:hypothetical protein
MVKFLVEEGIEVQTEQLKEWKSVLIPEVYEALEEYAKRKNHLAKSGFDICRGSDLSNYIGNYMIGNRF